MGKKHISIFGSCVTRNLFNNKLMSEVFAIDKYAFQICPWDLFGESLELNEQDIYDTIPEDFTARMAWYDLNKVTLAELESVKSEYLIIDFYYAVASNIEKITYNGKTVYSTNTAGRYWAVKNSNSNKLKLEIENLDNSTSCMELKEKGLNKFANWIKEHYDLSKVILFIPSFADKYYDIDGILTDYENPTAKLSLLISIANYTNKFAQMLDNKPIIFDASKLEMTAQYGIFDDISRLKTPPHMHLTDKSYIFQSKKLLELLNFDIPNLSDFDLINYEEIKYRNLYIKLLNKEKSNVNISMSTFKFSLDDYIKRIENLNDFIIIFSAKDESSLKISKFLSKSKLGLKVDLGFRDSYIAVIDKKRNFIYEKQSQEKLEFNYKIEEGSVNICSAGWNAGNLSSINVLGKEISKNKRGLNIVILNSKTFEVVDSAYCDTFADEELTVVSDYFNNIKIKI